VQDLAESRAIFATGAVVEHPQAASLLAERGVRPLAQQRRLRGIPEALAVYEIP
jgi:class 3 adenylate cyclase